MTTVRLRTRGNDGIADHSNIEARKRGLDLLDAVLLRSYFELDSHAVERGHDG